MAFWSVHGCSLHCQASSSACCEGSACFDSAADKLCITLNTPEASEALQKQEAAQNWCISLQGSSTADRAQYQKTSVQGLALAEQCHQHIWWAQATHDRLPNSPTACWGTALGSSTDTTRRSGFRCRFDRAMMAVLVGSTDRFEIVRLSRAARRECDYTRDADREKSYANLNMHNKRTWP